MSAQPTPTAAVAPAPRKPIKPAKMVGWFDPGQLARTGLEVVVSTLFGRHSDFRLLEALVPQSGECDFFDHTYNYIHDKDGRYVVPDRTSPRAESELWFDYVSDVGDGWNPTYTMAYYLGLPALELQLPDNRGKISTQQGTVLVFGGDEVYPTASRRVYEERLMAPYQAAYQSVGKPPHVYAVPGNHDWYDSLVAFTRLFSQQRWFAGWQTHQTRSYFAIKLPRGWWILGTDVQLGSDVDKAQVDYFNEIADKHMQPEDRVILCNAEPHWVYSAVYKGYDATVYNESNLKFLDDLLDNRVRVYLAGDLHHYRRHEDPRGNHKITAGGGGAFLHPTHAPDALDLEKNYTMKSSFPDSKTSRKMTWGNLKFGLTNPQFGLATGLIYTLTLWAIKPPVGTETNLFRAAKTTLAAALASPFEASWVLAIFLGFLLFTDTHSKPYRMIAGSVHGLTHLFAAFLIGWGSLYAITKNWGLGDDRPIRQLAAFGALMFAGGYLAGPIIMGLYLLISLNGFKRHSNEAFSALKSEDYKNFLRMKIDQNGDLTIFPIGIRRVPRKWKETEEGTPGARFVPDDKKATEPELIEAPIVVRKGGHQ
jgi:3',5'-cyclic AMP phosphodiesterase CpdA